MSVWLALFCSVSYRCEEILRKVTKGEWFTLAHSARAETLVTMKCRWKECDVAGRVSATVRKLLGCSAPFLHVFPTGF